MKRCIALVLSLVMALSLTTVAWGAPTAANCANGDTCTDHVAAVGADHYDDLQEAIKDAAPNGTVKILKDVTVGTWVMFSQTKTIGNGQIITLNMDGLTINGNGHTLTVNNVESANNGGYLFDNAKNLNIYNLTIKMNCNAGGIDLESGTIDTVTFEGGNCIFPDGGAITVNNCTFNTDGYVIYYETARDGLVVTNNTFNVDPAKNVMILYGGETFTGNTVNSGRTVNVVSNTATVTGNNFVDTRVKLYNEGQSLSGNSFGEDAYIAVEDNIASVDVSGNYWGGGAPSATQIPTDIADQVKVDSYKVVVTFDPAGGTMTTATQTDIVAGGTATKPTDPTKDDYTFKGWTLNGTAYDFNTAVTDDITLVATWEEVQTGGDEGGNGGNTGDEDDNTGGTTTPTYPNYYWPVGGTTTTEPEVTSPKTFDAGVALYVGMSVAAAVGTVTLSKKRED